MKIFRFIIIILVLLALSLGLHYLVYGSTITYEYASNSMFVIGVVMLLPSVIVITGSYEIFYGIRYTLQALFVRDFRGHYPTFREFKKEKMEIYTTSFFLELLIASLLIVVIATVLTLKVTV